MRAVAAGQIEPEGDGVLQLADLIASDPSPEVRRAAAGELAGTESAAAVNALVGTLDDSDPEVVIEALDSLVFAGDETVIPQIRPYTQHSNRDIAEAALEAVEFLE
ncbi:MAG: HEAT repeat domain-containing protein [Myxococcota bacterium]